MNFDRCGRKLQEGLAGVLSQADAQHPVPPERQQPPSAPVAAR